MHLFHQLSRKVSYNPEAVELFDRLLWLRNRYQCDVFDEALRAGVLKTVDEALNKYMPGLRSEDRHAAQ